MQEPVVIGYARTPIGRLGGSLASCSAVELAATAIRSAVAHAEVEADAVGYVTLGHVLQAGAGQLPARQASLAAGLGMSAPAEVINKVCLSGMTAIGRASDLIRTGRAELVVAGGTESMSNAPYLLDRARFGYRLGDATLIDSVMHDGLTCAIDGCSMGLATDRYQIEKSLRIAREDQDDFAARSHQRAAAAAADGSFAGEITPVKVQTRSGPTEIAVDEGIRADTTATSLAGLRPAFDDSGSITAGNASQISDGAAAVVLASRSFATTHGLTVRATIDAWASVAGPDPSLHLQPAEAIRAAASMTGADPGAFDLYEINEAFASVAIASMRTLGLDDERVNVRGGGIALGHPIGCSGARIVVTLIDALRARGGGDGVAALCGGGGQGDALLLSVR